MFRQTALLLLLTCFASQPFSYAEDKGQIQVKCEPGISILLDGNLKGVSTKENGGLTITDVPVGVHELKALKEGFAPQVKTVTVEKDRAVIVELSAFVPSVGSLEIRTLPVECQVNCPGIGITNRKKTKDPWSAGDVPAGKYDLVLERADKTLKLTIEIRESCKTVVTADFAKKEITAVILDLTAEKALRSIAKNAPFALVAISPGTFLMGSLNGEPDEKIVHRVNITKPFLIGETEVTQAQYRAVMKANPSCYKGDNLPVDQASWDDATEFLRQLTESERKKGNLPQGMEYRLPTEAEWEYCCRAGSVTEYFFGDDAKMLADYAWFDVNSGDTTHPVGKKKPNAWGLHDMHGNVWEWCYDWYGDKYPPEADHHSDPMGPATGQDRVLRGGSFGNTAGYCRSARRCWNTPNSRDYNLGFRVVVSQAIEWK
ncbi:MAG: SUMF1/EgtB/PvdO family nonheme iron enzyme [Candidatus Brocadiia bacterium]